MKNASLNWVRLPLEGVENCRELGGYATAEGQQTAWHTFLRSSDLTALTNEDILFLKQYGLKHVIDLRSADEIEKMPNPLAARDFNSYSNIPLINSSVSNLVFSDAEFSLGTLYINLLEKSEGIVDVLKSIASQEGVTLFHCAAGKDRTGIIAMLLLGLADVTRKDIVTNYEVTYSNIEQLRKQYDAYVQINTNINKEMMYSKGEYIIQAYDYIMDKHGSIESYVKFIGLTDDEIHRIKKRFIISYKEKMDDVNV